MYSKVGRENVRLFAAARPSVDDGNDDKGIEPGSVPLPQASCFSLSLLSCYRVIQTSLTELGRWACITLYFHILPPHRVTPFEWQPPHPCIQEPTELESILSLHNCFWHNWGSVMQQGSDIAPA